ncbi:unnamed protein product, partial [Ascophyllum nodosum]
LQQETLQCPILVYPRRSQQLSRPRCWEARLESTTRRAADVENDGRKCLNSSMQRRRILMRKLNGMVMRPNQDPDKYLTRGFRQHDDLEHIDESFTEGRMLDFILVGLSDEYKPIQLA